METVHEAAKHLCRKLAFLEGTNGEEREKAEQEETNRNDEGWKEKMKGKDGKKQEQRKNEGWK